MSSPAPLRALLPEDAVAEASVGGLGRQLQLLIAQGDWEFVRGIAWQVNARVQWLTETPDVVEKAAGFVLLIISPFLAL